MSRRILLIDDTPEIAELLTYALRDRGYSVTAQGYDPEIVALVAELGAEAVVLDCSVLEMNESLFDLVREELACADLPVVIVSDTPDKAVAGLRAREARRVLIVPKPFTGGQVATALDQLFEAAAEA